MNMTQTFFIIEEMMMKKRKKVWNQLSKLHILTKLRKLELADVLWDFGTTSLYPSAMWDEKLIHPKIETGYASTPDLNDEFARKSNTRKLTEGSVF